MEKGICCPVCPRAYDKISVIIIALNEKVSSEDSFIGMINTLFSVTIPYPIKKKRLEEEYHISMSGGLEKEVDLMCNLSDYVEEKGIQKGIRNMIINLLKLGTVSDEDLMKAGNLSGKNWEKSRKNYRTAILK